MLDTVHIAPGQQNATDVIKLCENLASLGVQQAIFNMPNIAEVKPLEIFGREIIPAAS